MSCSRVGDSSSTMWEILFPIFLSRRSALLMALIMFCSLSLFVSLTTMTRMVDENRIQIGTLKALGYSNIDIAKQYFYYGLLASIIGGIIGTILGFKVISPLVYRSYLKAFIFKKVFDSYYPQIIVVGILIAIFCTAFVSYVTCIRTLKKKISSLDRDRKSVV